MQRWLALVVLAAAACTQHADGECLWVPGDDGTCSGRGGGGGGDYDPPPIRGEFTVAGVAAGWALVVERVDGARTLRAVPLDGRGMPAGGPLGAYPDHDTLETWPGPAGEALAVFGPGDVGWTVAGLTYARIDAGGLRPAGTLTPATVYEVTGGFDGEAYQLAWVEFAWQQSRYRMQLARIAPDGEVGAITEPVLMPEDDLTTDFALASDGRGGALLVWRHVAAWRTGPVGPRELMALTLRDGAPVGPPWRIARDDDARGRLGEAHRLLFTAGGYRLVTSRRTDGGARLIDLAIDPTSHAVTEADSPLALAELPPRWVAGVERFLVADASHAWTVDAELGTATAVWDASPREGLTALGAVGAGFVAGLRAPGRADLLALAPTTGLRTTVGTDYTLPAEDSGCAAGGRPSLAPGLAALALALARRRRRPVR